MADTQPARSSSNTSSVLPYRDRSRAAAQSIAWLVLRKTNERMRKTLGLLLILILLSGCAKPGYIKRTQLALGTVVEITVADTDKPKQNVIAAIDKAFAEIERIENLLSRFKPESEISRINADANIRATKVSPGTIDLIEKSILFSRLTDGAFDITIYPLMQLWGFDKDGERRLPKSEELSQALAKVGYQYIDLAQETGTVFLAQKGMCLDLGAIAKGFAVDKAIAVLKQEGINRALVNAGGDIYALGKPDKSKKWRIAVQHPRKPGAYLTSLEIEDTALATSGDYQKFVEIGAKRYNHIINPQTGLPCENSICSVTILAEDCLTADALATSVFILGADKGMDLVNRYQGAEAIVVNFCEGKLDVLSSQGLQGKTNLNL